VALGLRRNVRTILFLVLLFDGVLLLATSLDKIRWFSVRNNGEVLVTLALLSPAPRAAPAPAKRPFICHL
jgi:drug/metabolite transporter (DMT)-like permease